jgi:hypothetical protein
MFWLYQGQSQSSGQSKLLRLSKGVKCVKSISNKAVLLGPRYSGVPVKVDAV